MWAYLDLIPGGSAQSVDAAHTLPFSADIAVRIDGPESGGLYSWSGSKWNPSTDESAFTFAHGSSGDTEARIVRSLTDDQSVRLLAFASAPESESSALLIGVDGTMGAMAEDSAQPWVVFPNTNPLGGTMTASYSWYSPLVDDMNDGQPSARTVGFSAVSPQASGVAWCPGSTLTYAITLQNPEPTEIAGLKLILEAIEGLGFQSLSGGTRTSGDAGGPRWEISVPTIAAGATHQVVVTALLDDDLTNVSTVTTHVLLTADTISLTGTKSAAITHRVDGQPPTATIDVAAGAAIPSGATAFTGTAGDDDGSGVAKVEVRETGTAEWTTASGATAWSAMLNVPGGATTFTLEARAVDACGHTGDTAIQAFTVDDTAPQVSWAVPAVITSTLPTLKGSASDPQPEGALVERVQVQVGGDDAPWLATTGPYAPVDGVQGWTWGWAAPLDDGVTHQLRARATDGVGNTTTTDWSSTTVDVVAPVITMTTAVASVSIAPLSMEVQAPDAEASAIDAGYEGPILAGTVADGSGVEAVRIWVYGPSGSAFVEDASLTGSDWEYDPDLRDWEIGTYALRVQAIDVYGNAQVFGPHPLELGEEPIEGLQAISDSPKPLGETVTLTATISAGTHVTYTWSLGDGAVVDQRIATHLYAAPGLYTATVTATNTISQVSASVLVLVEAPVTGLVANNDGPVVLGDEAVLSATVEAGSNVVYDWSFGDGETGSGASVTHQYPAVGSYTAEVTAHNSISSITATTTVVVAEAIAGLQAHASAPEAVGAAVALSATVSAGSNVAYAWDYGDGETGSGESVTHAYAAAGTYTATVTATNDVSQDDASVTVLIEVPASGLAASNDGPTPLGGETTLSATVEAGSNVVYDWAFGDGETGSGAAVIHRYAAPGTYVAEVTAHNSTSSITATTTVVIEPESGQPSTPQVIHLPAACRRYAHGPDLTVTSIHVDADGIAVTVHNAGNAPVVDGFWVDLYVAPREAPTAVGQIWQDLGEWGMVWGVTGDALPLAAGASLTLRGGDALYDARYSVMPETLPAGTEVYAQVDPVASASSYGAVLEIDELDGGASNNIAGPVIVSEDVVVHLEAIDGDTPRMSGRPEVQ